MDIYDYRLSQYLTIRKILLGRHDCGSWVLFDKIDFKFITIEQTSAKGIIRSTEYIRTIYENSSLDNAIKIIEARPRNENGSHPPEAEGA